MRYSFNVKMDRSNMAFAYRDDVNASYKDLGAVCDAIRYLKTGTAMKFVEKIADKSMPVPYRRHNKHMGARTELHGRKGAYPIKAAKELKVALQNAIANGLNNAMDTDEMVVVHASANKSRIERRYPSKGGIIWGRGMYGRSATMHSDLEYAKIEIALAYPDDAGLTKTMKYFISRKGSLERTLRYKHGEGAAPKTAEKKASVQKKPEAKKDADAKSAEKKPQPGAKKNDSKAADGAPVKNEAKPAGNALASQASK